MGRREADMNRSVVGLLWAVAAVNMHAASAEERTPLSIIEQQLAENPPTFGNHEKRLRPLEQLDKWALAPDTVYWDRKAETSNEEFAAFYRRRIDKALREIAQTRVLRGAAIWKTYSSGFAVKTPDGVLAIDVVEGPLKSIRRHPDDYPDFKFKWTPQQRDEYARLVDVHLVTHWHYDHTSYALCRLLAERGKTVVVTRQIEKVWSRQPFAVKLTVLAPNVDHALGPFVVRTFDGVQSMESGPNGEWIRGPKDVQNNIYWVQAGSLGFLHNGDNRGVPWYAWLDGLEADGKRVDVFFAILGWPRDMHRRVTDMFDPIIIPGHEHEMGHKPKYGVSTHAGRYRGLRSRFVRNKAVQMAWGEVFVLGEAETPGTAVK